MVKNGRYGPYVTHDGINATLPADMTPETVTLEQAVGLLDARAAKGGGKRGKGRPKAKRPRPPAEGAPKARRAAGRKTASGKAGAAPAAKPKKARRQIETAQNTQRRRIAGEPCGQSLHFRINRAVLAQD